MAWNRDWLVLSTEELERPEQEIDRAAEFFRSLGSPGMSIWAVQTLADELDVQLVALRDDPVQRIEDLAGLFAIALRGAGRRRPWERGRLTRDEVVPFIRELLDLVREWRDETGPRDRTSKSWPPRPCACRDHSQFGDNPMHSK